MACRPRALSNASDALSQVRLAGDPEWIGLGADWQHCGYDRDQSQTFAARVRSLRWIDAQVFARLCAFQRVIRFVGQKAEVDWASTATTCGYHDQAHLIHEFRAFSGLTPASYLMKRGPFLN